MKMKGPILAIIFVQSALGFRSSSLAKIRTHNSLAFDGAIPCPQITAFSPSSHSNQKAARISLGMVDDSAASDEKPVDSNNDVSSLIEKIAGRRKRLIGGYKIMTGAFALFGSMLILRTKIPFFGMPSLMAAGLSYIMIGAAENNRLTSDTYKRLNIALFEFAVTGFLAGFGMRLGTSYKFNAAWLLMFFVAIVNSIKGYGYGLKGWELGNASASKDLMKGMKSTLQSMTKIPNIKSLGYLAATLYIGFLKLQQLGEVFCGKGLSQIVGPLIGLARLMVLTITLFTLKDAADRDRLEGTTFIQLNALSSLSFLAWAAFRGTAGTPLRPILGVISGFTAVNGISSLMKKKKE